VNAGEERINELEARTGDILHYEGQNNKIQNMKEETDD
jgi:hypothetical protein